MAKEFRVYGAFRNCSAVYGNKFSVFSGTELMYDFGEGFFTTTTFASNEHGHVGRCHLCCHLYGMVELGAVTYYSKPLFYTQVFVATQC